MRDARNHLVRAQERMRLAYDQHHREVSFTEDQWVWLRLQPYRQFTAAKRAFAKLSPIYFGPFKILKRIGKVAYKLALSESKIHDVVHISMLKAFKGPPPSKVPTLPDLRDGKLLPQPLEVIRSRLNKGVKEVLVIWAGMQLNEATWENLNEFQLHFPSFKLEDKLQLNGGINDAFIGHQYQRKAKNQANQIKDS